MIRMQVQLTEEQVERLKEVARHRKEPMAALVREAVDLLLQHQPYLTRAQKWERLMALAGAFHDPSGATDVSERHDEYLADISYEHLHGDVRR